MRTNDAAAATVGRVAFGVDAHACATVRGGSGATRDASADAACHGANRSIPATRLATASAISVGSKSRLAIRLVVAVSIAGIADGCRATTVGAAERCTVGNGARDAAAAAIAAAVERGFTSVARVAVAIGIARLTLPHRTHACVAGSGSMRESTSSHAVPTPRHICLKIRAGVTAQVG